MPFSYHIQTQPQFTYEYPQLSHYAPIQPGFGLIPGTSYYPSGAIYYPPAPVAPIATYPTIIPAGPIAPAPGQPPLQPQQPAQPAADPAPGDADTAIIDSAEFPQQDQQQSAPAPKPPASEFPPASNFPLFPPLGQNPLNPQDVDSSFPQGSEESTTPSAPTAGSGSPSFPQFPQLPQFPQFPQGSGTPSFPQLPQFPNVPGFPQFPQFPSNPSNPQQPSLAPPTTFPSANNDDKGLNDEDTISVESA